jgi:hypothetical protein
MARARSDHRRLLPATVVAIMAAALTYGGLGAALNLSEQSSDHQLGPPSASPTEAAPATDRAEAAPGDARRRDPIMIGDDHRTLALDGHTVLLPIEVGHQVEVVALLPTIESVEASVVAESATVVAVDESVVVIRLTAEEARRAVEAVGVGSLTLLGTG